MYRDFENQLGLSKREILDISTNFGLVLAYRRTEYPMTDKYNTVFICTNTPSQKSPLLSTFANFIFWDITSFSTANTFAIDLSTTSIKISQIGKYPVYKPFTTMATTSHITAFLRPRTGAILKQKNFWLNICKYYCTHTRQKRVDTALLGMTIQ